MIPHHSSTNSYSNPSPLNPFSNRNTTSTTITGLVDNTHINNNVFTSNIINSHVASTSYDVMNNIMNRQWHSEFEFPPGYRFCPKDDELVQHYLQRKILNFNLPIDKIKDINLYSTTPIKLSEEYEPMGEKEWYFFTPRERKYKNGSRPNRSAGDGYWKATGADKKIYDPKRGEEVIGYKKALVFYIGKSPHGAKTNWIMHEFRVRNPPKRKRLHDSDMRLDDCVLCKIYNKEEKPPKGKKKSEEINNEPIPSPIPSSDDQEVEEEVEEEAEEELQVVKDENLPLEEAQLLYNSGYIDRDAMGMGLYEERNPPQFFYSNDIVKSELDCIVKKDDYPPQLPHDFPYTFPDCSQNGMNTMCGDFYNGDYQRTFEDDENILSFFSGVGPFSQGESSGENSTLFGDAELNYKFINPTPNNLENSAQCSPPLDDHVVID